LKSRTIACHIAIKKKGKLSKRGKKRKKRKERTLLSQVIHNSIDVADIVRFNTFTRFEPRTSKVTDQVNL